MITATTTATADDNTFKFQCGSDSVVIRADSYELAAERAVEDFDGAADDVIFVAAWFEPEGSLGRYGENYL